MYTYTDDYCIHMTVKGTLLKLDGTCLHLKPEGCRTWMQRPETIKWMLGWLNILALQRAGYR